MSLFIQTTARAPRRVIASHVRKDAVTALVRAAAQRTVATLCAERSAAAAREVAFLAMVRGRIHGDAMAVKVSVTADVTIHAPDRAAYYRALRAIGAVVWGVA